MRYEINEKLFSDIPGLPIAYWLSNQAIMSFKNTSLANCGVAQEGIKTGNNDVFLRYWFEVAIDKTNINGDNKKKWLKTSKAGENRKWYGSHYIVTNFEDNGQEMLKTGHASLTGAKNFFKPAITWNRIGTENLSFRYLPNDFLPNMGGLCFYPNTVADFDYILSFLNSSVSHLQLNVLNPTMSFPPGTINSLSIKYDSNRFKCVDSITQECINFAQQNWDSFETSWDFKKHPLI